MRYVPRSVPRWVWLAVPLAYLMYFYQLNGAGMLGPDEPRYASIGREMARSGDWVTPRLWGEPWFEKPPLLYWLTAVAFRLGIGPDWAPRLPIAIIAVAFLIFYWRLLATEFGTRPASMSTLILGTTWGWIGYGQIGVTDLLVSATFSAAMLLALPWVAKGDRQRLPLSAALLALAVLAKGLGPIALSVPLAARRRFRDLLSPRVWLPFLVIALPWYVLCYLRNGRQFVEVLFIQQHFGRLASTSLGHAQPWWFYVPILAAGLLPWTPLAPLLFRRASWNEPRRAFLLAWLLFGLIFFSIFLNKLPGYILPLVPAAAALMALALDEIPDARPWLAASALFLVVFPIAVQVLPGAVAAGLSRALHPHFAWPMLLPAAAAIAVWFLRSRLTAVALLAVCATAGVVYLKVSALPELDRAASARPLWRQIESRADQACIATLSRDPRFGLNYYSVVPLPDCSVTPKPLPITKPETEPRPKGAVTAH
jgi:4-amino-4-deoxy-L-arabinose transferase